MTSQNDKKILGGKTLPIVSVIIPIYNAEDYLKRCLDSLINQTLQDIEIILVNDGSLDESGYICKMYEKKDSRVKVIHKNNGGVSMARNSGIEIATGRFISFLDSDDWVDSNFLDVLVKNAIGHNSDMVVCGYRSVFEDGKIIKHKMDNDLIVIERNGISKYLISFLQFKHTFSVWNKLYRKDLIKKHAINFDPQISFGEDLLFNLIYLSHTNVISTTSMELINYSQRADSLSRVPANVLFNATHLVGKYEIYVKKNNVINHSPIVFCSQFVTALYHLRSSKNKGYLENCIRSTSKNKLFKKYCMQILLNKECSNFMVSQGNNFKGRLSFKLIVLMLMLGQDLFAKKLIKVS
jgi:glycosyltransferase involved in cell wall biosynthesis